jgi:hypothetical protein
MAEKNGQDKGPLEALLAEMPRIAEAVSKFPEALQQQAFDKLMAAATGGQRASATEAGSTSTRTERKRRPARRKNQGSKDGAKTRRRSSSAPSQLRDLDLTPKGKQSLKEFVAEKQPKTNHDRNTVSVYYLIRIAGITPVTIDHVYTCFRDMSTSWRLPANLANSVALTANRKRFLDTANLQDIKLTPPGINRVEHDLPPKRKKS